MACTQITGRSPFGNLDTVGDHLPFLTECMLKTASLASPAQSGSREITCRTLAAVTCDAEEP